MEEVVSPSTKAHDDRVQGARPRRGSIWRSRPRATHGRAPLDPALARKSRRAGKAARLDPRPAIGHPTPVPQSPVLAPGGGRLGWREPALAALLYAVATVVLTWPLFRHPATTVLDTRSLYG